MIPQAITNRGPYADLWSRLKSISHALNRATKAKNVRDLSALDKERLVELSQLLGSELFHAGPIGEATASLLSSGQPFETAYALALDQKQFLRSITTFEQWHSGQKPEKKLQKLQGAIDHYLNGLSDNWLPNQPPEREFKVLEDVISGLVMQTESALQA